MLFMNLFIYFKYLNYFIYYIFILFVLFHIFNDNIDKSQVMRVSRSNESLQIKVCNRELKEFDHFKYLGSVLTRDGYCTMEIKMRIAIAKDEFLEKQAKHSI